MRRNCLIVVAAAAIAAFFVVTPPIVQAQSYHLLADARAIWGIPNFWNVVSNVPFAVVGLLGLWNLRGIADRVLFAGVLLTCLGSSYYHLAPNDSRLVWDRLPMTIVFMSTLTCVVTRASDSRIQVRRLVLLVTLGIASVMWWNFTGDLRPYVLVQFGSMLLLIPLLWFVRDARWLAAVAAFYGLAKAAEFWDHAIFQALPLSGHTAKHILAALATYFIYRWRMSVATCADAPRKALAAPAPATFSAPSLSASPCMSRRTRIPGLAASGRE